MNFFTNLFRLSFIIGAAFTLVACQTTNKTAETVEESTDNFEYIQSDSQSEQERLEEELVKAQVEADKAREAQALAEERAIKVESDEAARAETEAARAEAEAARAEAEAAKGTKGVVNDNVPMGVPTSSVYFDFDKSFIFPKFDDVIQSHAGYLRANPDLKVEVQGNCDERGSREYNIGLGNRRALAVKAALELLGVQGRRITITSFGSEKPMSLGHDESSWQQNRRADFVY